MISNFFGQKNWLTEHQLKVTATALGLEYNAGTRRRMARANAILFYGLVKSTSLDGLYKVESQFQKNKTYLVLQNQHGWQCTCPDYDKNRQACKHAIAVAACNLMVDLSAEMEVIEAFDQQDNHYRFLRYLPTNNLPALEVSDEN